MLRASAGLAPVDVATALKAGVLPARADDAINTA